MSNPKVSVILPTYNQAQWLENCLLYLQGQSFSDYEIIIVNDGSTDDTKRILDNYAGEKLGIVTLEKNNGLPNALNVGFNFAKGEYLTWVSSDCWVNRNFLEVLEEELDWAGPEIGMVYSDFNIVGENGEFIKKFCWPNMSYPLLLIRNLGNASFLYRRSAMDRIGLYDTDLFGCEDWDYWIRMGEHYRFKHICQPLYNYRWHSKSLQSTKREMVLQSRAKMMQKTFNRLSEIL